MITSKSCELENHHENKVGCIIERAVAFIAKLVNYRRVHVGRSTPNSTLDFFDSEFVEFSFWTHFFKGPQVMVVKIKMLSPRMVTFPSSVGPRVHGYSRT